MLKLGFYLLSLKIGFRYLNSLCRCFLLVSFLSLFSSRQVLPVLDVATFDPFCSRSFEIYFA
ncbi:hypothetical protein WB44_00270 [Synechococcus sp. WH 8020]|nr:hypothetical protein WB44_00270 [Synechococcus sp. WH 8020]